MTQLIFATVDYLSCYTHYRNPAYVVLLFHTVTIATPYKPGPNKLTYLLVH